MIFLFLQFIILTMKTIEERIAGKISTIAAVADELPVVVIIHRFSGNTSTIEYMSKRGLRELNISLEALKAMGGDYFRQYMNQQDAEDYIPKVFELLQKNDEKQVITFFQQVRTSLDGAWEWHLSSIKILMRDDEGKPLLLIVTSMPVTPHQHLTSKVTRLLEENNFIRQHYHTFGTLTAAEKSVLKLIASGKSNKEISTERNISVNTAETHRKNIKAKLGVKTGFELQQYARAFEL